MDKRKKHKGIQPINILNKESTVSIELLIVFLISLLMKMLCTGFYVSLFINIILIIVVFLSIKEILGDKRKTKTHYCSYIVIIGFTTGNMVLLYNLIDKLFHLTAK